MELTAEQRRVVEHTGGPLRVLGGGGHGKTTALTARYLELVRAHGPSTVLVVCPTRIAAHRFRDAVLPHLVNGFDALPITTWFGVAFDLAGRAGRPVHLLSSREQRDVVRRLLALESAQDWPLSGEFLGRDAFTDEVAAALLEHQARGAARGSERAGRWQELGRFAGRYLRVLADRGQVDRAGLLAAATAATAPGAYRHVLVDDHDAGDASLSRLLAALTGSEADVTIVQTDAGAERPWPAADIVLTRAFRHPVEPTLVSCPHPSTEPEAVAGELLAARAGGVAWSEMAVLVRRPQVHGRRIVRTLARHGIPVAPETGFGPREQDPAVTAVLDMLRWVAEPDDPALAERLSASPVAGPGPEGLAALRDELVGRAPGATPAELAFLVWERALGHLVSGDPRDDTALDAVVALLDRLERQADSDPSLRLPDLLSSLDEGGPDPDPWRASSAVTGGDRVTLTSIAASAGREWRTVVLTGCVEGELPKITGRAPLFDPALLDDGGASPTPAERRVHSLANERRLFAVACSRATERIVATAAPQPGVLLSRFVERWATRPAQPLHPTGPAPVRLEPTAGTVDVFPGGRLVLSASQLDTYDDCPLRYAYQYGLRVRDEAGAPAALGTLVHEVLAEFLRPDRPAGAPPRTRQELLALAAERWTDDIAVYRPQIEECRRDYYRIIEDWWSAEGEGPAAPQVLDVERRFDVEVGDLRLIGAIDRVDRADDGEGIRIVDYKTGKKEPRADAMPDDLQLAIYHLAATRDPELVALGAPRQLRLLYLRSMHAFEQPVVAGHAEATMARVAAAATDIRAERFDPSVDASCRNCSFHRLCPLQSEGREVGAG